MTTTVPHQEAKKQMTEIYDKNRGLFKQLHDYGEQVRALSLELHVGRLQEEFALVEEMILLTTLDVRETPPSLEISIQKLKEAGATVDRIVFSRPEGKFFVFGQVPSQKVEIQQEPTPNLN